MPNKLDLSGQRFGRLLVECQSEHDGSRYRKTRWHCLCDCGNRKSVRTQDLRNGGVRSCGCLEREARYTNARTHGSRNAPEYDSWAHMVQRCCNPKNKDWSAYGGRGITICPEWRDDFATFLRDMGPRPSPLHSLDRYPDKSGNYEPGNCRWATATEQANNTRANRLITHEGRTMTLAEWARELKMWPKSLAYRLDKFGTLTPQRGTRKNRFNSTGRDP